MSAERDLLRKIIIEYYNDKSIVQLLIEAGRLLGEPEDEDEDKGLEIEQKEQNALSYAEGYMDGRSTLMDHFAGLAMQGYVAGHVCRIEAVASGAYLLAEAMLEERKNYFNKDKP